MAARRACQALSPDLQPGLSQVPATFPIKASCVTSADRNSPATRRALSKSAEPMRSDDEFFPTSREAGSQFHQPRSFLNPHQPKHKSDIAPLISINASARAFGHNTSRDNG